MLIETLEEKVSSEENLNQIQQDDQVSSLEDDEIQEVNTLTKEQDILFEAINSIHDPQENKVFLNKLKKSLEAKPKQKEFITNTKFNVSNMLKRLENTLVKPTTIQDLQTKIKNLKQEVKELRKQQDIHQIILSQFEEHSNSDNEIKGEEDECQDDEIFMGLINKVKIQKFYKNEVILGTPFIKALFPLQISKEGITTWHLGKKITFDFSTKPITKNINLIKKKINQINFLKDEVSFNNIQTQLEKPQMKEKIHSLLKHIQSTMCSNLPYAFWNRKKHIVNLLYEKDFRGKHIPTKARTIQMNEELF